VIAETPEPPYVAVIFTSVQSADTEGYLEAAERLEALVGHQPGFLGVESARGANGLGITISYWTDEAAVRAWRQDGTHTAARHRGRQQWYERFTVRMAEVSRAQAWQRTGGPTAQSDSLLNP
jgi:heme-degrading monooxygenase HmoA